MSRSADHHRKECRDQVRRDHPPSQLPASISSYLVAHQARDLDTAVGYYTEDAMAVDEGHAYRGPQQIRDWLATAASEYTYTIELTGARRIDDETRGDPSPGG